MKKFCLFTAGIFLSIFGAWAQQSDSAHKSRKLTFEEANLVSSYYVQNGDHAAVTGGIGTQHLTDLANVIDVKFIKYDKKGNKHHLGLEAGVDRYTSASSDRIDLKANSSASSADLRFYPTVMWSMDNIRHNFSVGLSGYFSNEFDYQSTGAGIELSKRSKDNNTEISFKGKVYLDQLALIYPVELRQGSGQGEHEDDDDDYARTARNSYSGSLSLSRVVNERLQLALIADVIKQDGYLGLPFHRVYFNDNSVHVENLPGSRLKFPIGIRANYFAGDKLIIRSFYRYYTDDWGLKANTADLELSYKLTPFLSVTPFYRYYQQQGNKYFAPYQQHTAADKFYTSNYDQSPFNSNFFGAGLRISTPGGVMGIQHFNMLELRFGHYTRSEGLNANVISLHIKAK